MDLTPYSLVFHTFCRLAYEKLSMNSQPKHEDIVMIQTDASQKMKRCMKHSVNYILFQAP